MTKADTKEATSVTQPSTPWQQYISKTAVAFYFGRHPRTKRFTAMMATPDGAMLCCMALPSRTIVAFHSVKGQPDFSELQPIQLSAWQGEQRPTVHAHPFVLIHLQAQGLLHEGTINELLSAGATVCDWKSLPLRNDPLVRALELPLIRLRIATTYGFTIA